MTLDEKISPATETETVLEYREYDSSVASPRNPTEDEEKPRLSWQTILAIAVSRSAFLSKHNFLLFLSL